MLSQLTRASPQMQNLEKPLLLKAILSMYYTLVLLDSFVTSIFCYVKIVMIFQNQNIDRLVVSWSIAIESM